MTEQVLAWVPTNTDRELIKHTLIHIASEQGLASSAVSQALLAQVEALMAIDGLIACTQACYLDQVGMILANRKRQLAYSVKLSNLLRDPVPTVSASSLMIAAAIYAPSIIDKIPPTFPAFLVGVTVAIVRAFAHPIGYGEAALLHALHRVSLTNGIVQSQQIQDLGAMLVADYGYIKGENRNEVEALLRSLAAWSAIEEVTDGVKIKETIPFGITIVDENG